MIYMLCMIDICWSFGAVLRCLMEGDFKHLFFHVLLTMIGIIILIGFQYLY